MSEIKTLKENYRRYNRTKDVYEKVLKDVTCDLQEC